MQWYVQALVDFNFVKLDFFSILLILVVVHVFNVAFAFSIVFHLFCLLNENGKVLQYFKL